MKCIANFDLGGLGVEKWLVNTDDYDATIAAFEAAEDRNSLDAAAAESGPCPVLCAHWGTQDLPMDEDDLADLLEDVRPEDRAEVAELVRESWM